MNFDQCNILHHRPHSAYLFFKVMMRLEYSLKKRGVVVPLGREGRGAFKVDWNTFANRRLGSDFYDQIVDESVAETLINNPPKKQVWRHEALEFQDVERSTDVQKLIGAVCRVRNNLFHGGKAGDLEHDRNNALIEESLEVIRRALERDHELAEVFEKCRRLSS